MNDERRGARDLVRMGRVLKSYAFFLIMQKNLVGMLILFALVLFALRLLDRRW